MKRYGNNSRSGLKMTSLGSEVCDINGETMNRKEKLLSYMTSSTYVPLKFDELVIVLDVPKQDKDELMSLLEQLEAEGRI